MSLISIADEVFIYIDRYSASANSELFDLEITYTSSGSHHLGTRHLVQFGYQEENEDEEASQNNTFTKFQLN